jgi:hypothetical protein
MKRVLRIFFSIFFVAGNAFAQSHPTEVFHNFWKMALSNNFESAQLFVVKVSPSEFKDKQIRDSFQIISENKLAFPEIENPQVFTDSAYYVFQIESENKRKFKGQVLLLNQDRQWKILLFDVRPVTERKVILPFQPPRDFPILKDCPKCG